MRCPRASAPRRRNSRRSVRCISITPSARRPRGSSCGSISSSAMFWNNIRKRRTAIYGSWVYCSQNIQLIIFARLKGSVGIRASPPRLGQIQDDGVRLRQDAAVRQPHHRHLARGIHRHEIIAARAALHDADIDPVIIDAEIIGRPFRLQAVAADLVAIKCELGDGSVGHRSVVPCLLAEFRCVVGPIARIVSRMVSRPATLPSGVTCMK